MEPSNKKPKREVTKNDCVVNPERIFEWRDFLAPVLPFCGYRCLTNLRAANRHCRTMVALELEQREQRILDFDPDVYFECGKESDYSRVSYVLKMELNWPEPFTNWDAMSRMVLRRAKPNGPDEYEVARRLLRERGMVEEKDFLVEEDRAAYDAGMVGWQVFAKDFVRPIDYLKAWQAASQSPYFENRHRYGGGSTSETLFALLSRARSD